MNKQTLHYWLCALLYCSAPIALLAEQSSDCISRQSSTIQVCTIEPQTGIFSARTIALKIPLEDYRLAVVRAQDINTTRTSVKTMANASKAMACINANFFDTRGAPLGLVVSEGRTYQKIHKIGSVLTGIFSVSRSGPEIVHRDLFSGKDALEAIQSGPRLIEKGVLTTGLKEGAAYSRRSAVCLDGSGNVILASSSAGIRGTPLNDFALTLKSPPYHVLMLLIWMVAARLNFSCVRVMEKMKYLFKARMKCLLVCVFLNAVSGK